jgi:putative CocE/NonD family hydrolase
MGENQWQQADQWPPSEAEEVTFYLNSSGGANSLFGDGSLSRNPPLSDNADGFTYDPMNPVPALGGNVCCNGGASLGGSYDQRAIEARADVLVYTSEELSEDTEVTGTIRTKLFISSDALDTDFTIKLVDVHLDGTAYNVDDTIQRARYRDGYDEEVFMTPGETYEIDRTPLSTSYTFKAGHRIRLEVSSSKFPQYMRNLNTGGNNVDETEAVVARNSVHHGPQFSSRIVLPIVPSD